MLLDLDELPNQHVGKLPLFSHRVHRYTPFAIVKEEHETWERKQ